MGRAIDQDNRLDDHERRITELEGVVAELSQALMSTKQVSHVDLHNGRMEEHEKNIRKENTKTKTKKTTRKATATT